MKLNKRQCLTLISNYALHYAHETIKTKEAYICVEECKRSLMKLVQAYEEKLAMTQENEPLTAKEMFDELGFTCYEDEKFIIYINRKYKDVTIKFCKKTKTVTYARVFVVTIKEHMAVHEQFKELGWEV